MYWWTFTFKISRNINKITASVEEEKNTSLYSEQKLPQSSNAPNQDSISAIKVNCHRSIKLHSKSDCRYKAPASRKISRETFSSRPEIRSRCRRRPGSYRSMLYLLHTAINLRANFEPNFWNYTPANDSSTDSFDAVSVLCLLASHTLSHVYTWTRSRKGNKMEHSAAYFDSGSSSGSSSSACWLMILDGAAVGNFSAQIRSERVKLHRISCLLRTGGRNSIEPEHSWRGVGVGVGAQMCNVRCTCLVRKFQVVVLGCYFRGILRAFKLSVQVW